jgi:glycosyltransferase involved in cell wall biosynthesis
MMPRVRVLHVIDSLGAGGAQQLLAQAIRSCDDVEHSVFALHAEDDKYSEALRRIGADVGFAARSKSVVAVARSLLQRFRKRDFDLVHAHVDVSTILCCVFARSFRPAPLVVTLYASREQYPRWEFQAFRFLLRRATRVLSAGPHTTAALRQLGIVAPRVIEGQLLTVLPEPEATAEPPNREKERAALQLAAGDFAALRVARLFPDKGVVDLVHFVAGLRARGVPAVGLVVGDGPEGPALAAEAARLGVAQHVRFLGFRRDLPALHAAADVTVVTSRYDAMCQAVIDAMARRVAVIAYDIGCIGMAIKGESTGVLVPAGDIERLVDAGARLHARPELRAALVDAAQRAALQSFGLDGFQATQRRLWTEALAAARSAHPRG